MNVAVIGSRGITALDLSRYIPEDCTILISGGAMEVDMFAEQYAAQHGVQTMIIRPNYEKYGRSAPIRRNDIIIENADAVLAFWDGKSRGTKYVIEQCKKRNKPCYVFTLNLGRWET